MNNRMMAIILLFVNLANLEAFASEECDKAFDSNPEPIERILVEALYADFSTRTIETRRIMSSGDYNLAVFKTRLSRARSEHGPAPGYEASGVNMQVIRLIDFSDNTLVGSLQYNPTTDKDSTVFLDFVRGDEYASDRPVARALLKTFLARYPNTKSFRYELHPEDAFILHKALLRGLSPRQALASMPIFLALAAVGFGTIIDAESSVARTEEFLTVEKSLGL